MADPVSVTALIGSAVSIAGVLVVASSNTKNVRTQAEQDAFIRAKEIFKASIEELERRIASLTSELATEKRVSRSLRRQIHELDIIVSQMKTNMVAAGMWDVQVAEESS